MQDFYFISMKIVILGFVLLIPCFANGQYEKKTIFISGSSSFLYQKEAEFANSGDFTTRGSKGELVSSEVGASLGSFVRKGLLLGINFRWLNYTCQVNTPPPGWYFTDVTSKTNLINLVPCIRYYPVKRVFIQGDLFFGMMKRKESGETSYGNSGVSRVGTIIVIKPVVGYNVGLGYTFYLDSQQTFGLDVTASYKRHSSMPFTNAYFFGGINVNYIIRHSKN